MTAHLLRRLADRTPPLLLKNLANFWLPYLGAGIHIQVVSDDYRFVKVKLKRRWYNKNYVGTQFGGSIYAMTDPFYMLMIMNNLGRDYIVWDRAARIDFLKPGRSELTVEFRLESETLDLIREKTKNGEKFLIDLPVEVYDSEKNLVATVSKTLYIRKKKETLTPEVLAR